VEFIMDDFAQASLFFGYYHAHGTVPDRNGSSSNFAAAAFAFAARAFLAFEYMEVNGNPGFQNGTTDYPTGYYDLSSIFLGWKPMDIVTQNVTFNGTNFNVFVVTIQSLDDVFLMRFIAVGYDTVVEGVHITPTTIKVDVELRWFNPLHVPALWTTGPSNATLFPHANVGMFFAFAAAAGQFQETQDPNNNNKPGLQVASGNYTGFFSWEPKANVTIAGVEAEGYVYGSIQTVNDTNVNASFAVEWVLQAGFFSFQGDRPEVVSWDPEFGANILTTPTGTTSTGSLHSGSTKVGNSVMLVFFAVVALLLFVSNM